MTWVLEPRATLEVPSSGVGAGCGPEGELGRVEFKV